MKLFIVLLSFSVSLAFATIGHADSCPMTGQQYSNHFLCHPDSDFMGHNYQDVYVAPNCELDWGTNFGTGIPMGQATTIKPRPSAQSEPAHIYDYVIISDSMLRPGSGGGIAQRTNSDGFPEIWNCSAGD